MKSITLSFALIMWSYVSCQDIVYPPEKETFTPGGKLTERQPVKSPVCPENMLLYPGDGSKSTWVCDCKQGYLYFPVNGTCHEAYRQGPCERRNYVVLLPNESIPKCVENPCGTDGFVPYNNRCFRLKDKNGPCSPDKILGVNVLTYQLACITPKE